MVWSIYSGWQCCQSYHRACVFYMIYLREKHLFNLSLLNWHYLQDSYPLCLSHHFEFNLTLHSLSCLGELSEVSSFLVGFQKKNRHPGCCRKRERCEFQSLTYVMSDLFLQSAQSCWVPPVYIKDMLQTVSSLLWARCLADNMTPQQSPRLMSGFYPQQDHKSIPSSTHSTSLCAHKHTPGNQGWITLGCNSNIFVWLLFFHFQPWVTFAFNHCLAVTLSPPFKPTTCDIRDVTNKCLSLLGVKVGRYSLVLGTTKRFSAGTQYWEEGTAAACLNPHTTRQDRISNIRST